MLGWLELVKTDKMVKVKMLIGGINLVNVNVAVSNVVWHRTLRHPSPKILNSIIKHCSLSNNDFNEIEFCDYS